MKNDYQSTGFKKLLDKLQQESWQLELIISGFAIYGLFQTFEPLELASVTAQNNGNFWKPLFIEILQNCIEILCVSLLVHVFLRGLWIGAIGLRYVSGEIEYEKLGYSKRYTKYLEKKVGTFDRYIHRLENLCSTLFALAFLMVFYLMSFFAVFILFLVIMYISMVQFGDIEDSVVLKWFLPIFILVYALACLVLFIDFLTLGGLKKNRIISKIYFPVYRVFSLITLSFLYRPLVYNFLDQKYTRWVVMLILPFYILVGGIYSGFENVKSNILTENHASSSVSANNENYMEFIKESDVMLQNAIIPSKVIKTEYLEVFLPFHDDMEHIAFEKDSTLKPEEDLRGYSFSLGDAKGKQKVDQEVLKNYIESLNQSYQLKIGTTHYDSDFITGKNKFEKLGFLTVFDISQLDKGRHVLRIIAPTTKTKGFHLSANGKKLFGDVDVDFSTPDTLATIPFWYYPQNATSTLKLKTIEIDSATNK